MADHVSSAMVGDAVLAGFRRGVVAVRQHFHHAVNADLVVPGTNPCPTPGAGAD